ncbi:MAG: nucleotidyltransferase [Tindallia sp. MSAO_Bac2]|nr:MAG: nucleotidyltransferase [Tindallia sp. MSAO_Bac2]
MHVLGLVTEYNPFHNGHLYHLNKSKEVAGATHTIAVMSGHFLQRGEPAMLDKWSRAKMAVSCGVDLVVELPVIYSCATADQFARGSIYLLNQSGIIDSFCFGSESGNIDLFLKIGSLLANPPKKYESFLRYHINNGISFARSQQLAISEFFSLPEMDAFFQQPNNILGMLYMKHLCLQNSSIRAHTIQRIGAGYHSGELQHISSATGIRKYIESEGPISKLAETMPPPSYRVLMECMARDGKTVTTDDYNAILIALLRRMTCEEFKYLTDVTEGLENKLFKCAHHTMNWQDFCECVKSKRYPYTRIQRILMHILLNIKKADTSYWYHEGNPEYIRVLAFNSKGRELLSQCKTFSNLHIITKTAAYKASSPQVQSLLEMDIRSTDIYHLAVSEAKNKNGRLDYLLSPCYLP